MAPNTKEMRLVLSSDAKPRLKWTSDLHHRFIDAVDKLGGAEKATPKSLMRAMGIHGLTLYHLKSHLQKYRLGKSQQSQSHHQHKQQADNAETQRSPLTSKARDGVKEQINDLQMTRALKMQMDVQRELHEQIEVQRHLQQKIEAQGQYLQSVLEKAQETLSEYGSCSIEADHVKAQLSELVSMVDSGSSFSALRRGESSMLEDGRNKLLGHHGCSLESSLTSCQSSWRKDETQPNEYIKQDERNFIALETNTIDKNASDSQTRNIEQSNSRRSPLLEKIDLNCKSMNDFDPGPKMIDLNSMGE
ncbi:hypothetical protein ACS0TY_008906 [Phlomoides rotata]